jgi:putative membrane protein
MKYFNQVYKEKLAKAVSDIEKVSKAEVVVIVKPFSETYLDLCLLAGSISAAVFLTYFVFSPVIFGDYTLYTGTLFGFIMGFSIFRNLNPFLRKIISKKRSERSVEIMARALFQKGGIHHTRDNIGMLIYISLLEKKFFLLC